MDKDVLLAAQDLKDVLEKEPLIKEYHRLAKIIDSDNEIKSLQENIMLMKRQHASYEEIKAAEEAYNNHPVVSNFLVIQEEVEELLRQIKQIIE